MFDARLHTLSEGADVAGIHRNFFASLGSFSLRNDITHHPIRPPEAILSHSELILTTHLLKTTTIWMELQKLLKTLHLRKVKNQTRSTIFFPTIVVDKRPLFSQIVTSFYSISCTQMNESRSHIPQKIFSGGSAPQTPRVVRPSASGVRHVEFLRDPENFENSLSLVEFLR